ncbi:MAG TPA: bifunctional serine/threonine-protein kinase/formylglycine-generating enzyme family protein [Chthoniobacteraceae bacterium]|jgi:predicted Ser/Thr protein kinase|nr:bifunctional serine/threonine-protein kinase/formylglycine-generating enzyme family protein [Chthoniobacteraceae bacterium]
MSGSLSSDDEPERELEPDEILELLSLAMNLPAEPETRAPRILPSAEELGRLLPDFEIQAPLKRGGMGAVYAARQKKPSRPVALKILAPEYASIPCFVDRFNEEADLVGNLRDEGIVTVHTCGLAGAWCYIVMEMVDGPDLEDLIKQGGLPAPQALDLVLEVARALAHAHGKGVIHRDIKPSNIIVSRSTRKPVVVDFGLARLTGVPASAFTQAAIVAGSPPFTAPEQWDRAATGAWTDVYSLGVTLCCLLHGRVPDAAAGRKLDPKFTEVPGPPRLQELVKKATQIDPAARHQTMAELLRDLEDCRRPPPLPQKKKWQAPPLPFRRWPARAQAWRTKWRWKWRYAFVAAGAVALGLWQDWTTVLLAALAIGALRLPVNGRWRLGAVAALAALGYWNHVRPIAPEEATVAKPFVNSLEMKFIPLTGTNVLISTRLVSLQQYLKFRSEHREIRNDFDNSSVLFPLSSRERTDPVSSVDNFDANLFCEWLSQREHRRYRLPFAREIGQAAGPKGTEEIQNLSSLQNGNNESMWKDIESRSSPVVGHWQNANSLGFQQTDCRILYEWCSDRQKSTPDSPRKLWTGQALTDGTAVIEWEWIEPKYVKFVRTSRDFGFCFRCVLVLKGE